MSCPLVPPEATIAGNCGWCGKELPRSKDGSILHNRRWCLGHGRSWWVNHGWTWARAEALKRDNYRCVRCESKHALEVNHIVPRRGAGYGNGCHHHLDGLETLCHECHGTETKRQLREWKWKPTDPQKSKRERPARPSEAPSVPIWEFSA